MSDELVRRLNEEIERGQAMLVVGAGVSISASGGASTAGWHGLLTSGAQYATSVRSLPSAWMDGVHADLELAKSGYLDATLDVANKVENALGGVDHGDFKGWLRSDVGGLEVQDPDLILAIDQLNVPIVSTNYDNLIENVTGRPHVTWRDSPGSLAAVRGDSRSVFHIHGHWSQSDSVILGPLGYGRHSASEATQAVERAMATLRTLIFVGCGDGIEDPNFEALRAWLKTTFGETTEHRHYRLCKTDELARLRAIHSGERIVPVAFGDNHDDLTGFLTSLGHYDSGSAPAVQANAPVRALDAIRERVRADAVLAEHLPDVEACDLHQLVVPPILLPMHQEQFTAAQSGPAEERPRRCDAYAEALSAEHLLVVGEEASGLTTALEWLVAEANASDRTLVPVVVDFRSLSSGHNPLQRQLRKELFQAGAIADRRDDLPRCVLAVDNLKVRPEKIFNRALEELMAPAFTKLVLGCRPGTEAELVGVLASAGIQVRLRYIGRMLNRDAKALAILVAPSRAADLAKRAMDIVKREHLPRTPITLSLLLSVLLHGEQLLGTASETALLDAYVSLRLGRGDPHDDARFTLDSIERAELLGVLAERFVEQSAGSLPEAEVIEVFSKYFDAVGWVEDAVELLTNLRSRHLLTLSNGQVRFTQSTYLHLFAAKRAMRDADFRAVLFARPMHYGPILRHYAALVRNDPGVLRTVESLLGSAGEDPAIGGKTFEPIEFEQPITIAALLEQLEPRGNVDELSEEDEDEGPLEDWLEAVDDADVEPFPIESFDELSPTQRIMQVIVLVSNVLRDSELVQDLELKERVFRQTLVVWAKLVGALEGDSEYQAFLAEAFEEFSGAFNVPESAKGRLKALLLDSAPLLMAFGGMAVTLASRKLVRQLDESMQDPAFIANAGPAVMGAFLALDMQSPGWAKHLLTVQELHGRVRAVNVVLLALSTRLYENELMAGPELEHLEKFLVEVYASRTDHGATPQAKQNKALIAQALKRQRLASLAAAREQREITADEPKVVDGELVEDALDG